MPFFCWLLLPTLDMLMDAVIIFSNNGHHECQGQLPLLLVTHHCEAAQAPLLAHMSLHFCGLFMITSVCCKRKCALRGLWFHIKLSRKIKSPVDRRLRFFFSHSIKTSGYLYDKSCHDKLDLPSIAVNIKNQQCKAALFTPFNTFPANKGYLKRMSEI